MAFLLNRLWCGFLAIMTLFAAAAGTLAGENRSLLLGRDTVLVWKIQNRDFDSEFVVRIAEFSPDRFLEWEDMKTQGTVFMPSRDILTAKSFISTRLFESGIDSVGKNATTLWLSRKIFRSLKDKRKVKCGLDGISGLMTYRGNGYLTVEVNRSSRQLPVIIISDNRGSERWFLDQEENPLMVKHLVREFSQTLTSITTDRPNTLRWIKGKRLTNPPR